MVSVVITLIGDDRAGLVDAVSGVIATHGGSWDRSHMAELAGKFAGIVSVSVANEAVEALLTELQELASEKSLSITAQRAVPDASVDSGTHASLELVGQDHEGIVHEISHVLANHGVSIDELETTVTPAPQGGNLFIAHAVLEMPATVAIDELRSALEEVAHDLMVDLDLVP